MKKFDLLATLYMAFLIFLFSHAAHAQAGKIVNPVPEPIPKIGLKIKLEPLANGMTAPNWGISAPGNNKILFVTDQDGLLWAVDLKSGSKRIFLDVKSRLVPLGAFGPGSFDERGLLGVAFHPDYPRNGLFYTFSSEPASVTPDFPVPQNAPANCLSVITEWRVPSPDNAQSVADPTSARVLMRIAKPQFNHNGGAINFGPDGMLYIATGDGGAADDEGAGHGAAGNGQDNTNLLGKILRINPAGRSSPNGQYSVPSNNPFVPTSGPRGGQTGCADGTCDEIYAYGFRNPFRFSFDRKSGAMLAADVGQNDLEEIDVVQAGKNYGWNFKEGTFFFNGNGPNGPGGAGRGFVTDIPPANLPAGLVDPIAQYDHDEGVAIIGGFVYRGRAIDGLRGRYVFGEFARTFSNDGRLFHLNRKLHDDDDDDDHSMRKLNRVLEFRLVNRDKLGLSLLGMGEDADGELYVLANSTGTPFGTTGVILKITKANDRDDDDDDDDHDDHDD